MKSTSKQYLYSVFRQAMGEFRILGTKAMQLLMRTPLPRLLVLLIGLALILTIVPLLLSLFVVFILIKLLLVLVFMNVRKHNADGPHIVNVERIRNPYDDR
jgi:hypothetical protein